MNRTLVQSLLLALAALASVSSYASSTDICLGKACVGANLASLKNVNWSYVTGPRELDDYTKAQPAAGAAVRFRKMMELPPLCSKYIGNAEYLDENGKIVRVHFQSVANRPSNEQFLITGISSFAKGPFNDTQRLEIQAEVLVRWDLVTYSPVPRYRKEFNSNELKKLGHFMTRTDIPVRVGVGKGLPFPALGTLRTLTSEERQAFSNGISVYIAYEDADLPKISMDLGGIAHSNQPGCFRTDTPKF